LSRDFEKNIAVSMLLDVYGELLSDRQRDVMDMYYNQDLSLSEVAENTGITRQGVRDCVKKSEDMLAGFEKKLHILEKNKRIKSIAADILDELKKDIPQIENIAAGAERICSEL